MKNLKKFNELNEETTYYAPHKVNDAEVNSKKIDELLNVITTSMEDDDDDEMSTKASVLVVYMNLMLSEKDREEIKKNI